MRKAKVVAIVCGMIASCLIGGFAVVEAATVKLDESSTEMIDYVDTYEPEAEETLATTVTSIETTRATKTTTTTTTVLTEDETTAKATSVTTTTAKTTTTTDTTEAPETIPETTETQAHKVMAVEIEMETQAPTAAPAAVNTDKIASVAPATTPAPTTTQTQTVVETCAVITEPPTQESTPAPAPTPVEEYTEAVPVEEAPAVADPVPATQVGAGSVYVSDSDYILLCNAVAHEAGANNIPATEKAKVVEVIMNRVASSRFPNTIYGVLTQKYQFSGSSTYVDLGTFSYKVTDLVKQSVDLYLSDPSQFSEGYLFFYGDGKMNHFRVS